MFPVVRILAFWILGILLIPLINCTYDVVLGIEEINVNTAVNIDVLLMRAYRTDISEIQKVLSPDIVLLDACLSNKKKEKMML